MNSLSSHIVRDFFLGTRLLASTLHDLRDAMNARDSKESADALDAVFHAYMGSVVAAQIELREPLEKLAGGRDKSIAFTHADRALKTLSLAFADRLPIYNSARVDNEIKARAARACASPRLWVPGDTRGEQRPEYLAPEPNPATYVGERLQEGVQRLFEKAMDVGAIIPAYDAVAEVRDINTEFERYLCPNKSNGSVTTERPTHADEISTGTVSGRAVTSDNKVPTRQSAAEMGDKPIPGARGRPPISVKVLLDLLTEFENQGLSRENRGHMSEFAKQKGKKPDTVRKWLRDAEAIRKQNAK